MPITDDQVNFLNESTDQEAAFLSEEYGSARDPREAIENLDKAAYFEVDPDTYVEMKDELDPKYEVAKRIPSEVHPSVKKIQSTNREIAAATKDDTGVLSTIGDMADHVVYNVSGRDDLDEKIHDLTNLDVSGEINEKGSNELDKLLAQRNKNEEQFQNLSFLETLPGNVGKAIDDMAGAIKDYSGEIAAATASGAAYGALGGTVTLPVIGTGVGAIGVGTLALGNAMVASLAVDAYDKTVNDTWLTLRSGIKDDDGNLVSLTREQKLWISRGVGAAAGAFEFAGGKILGATAGKLARRKAILEFMKLPASRIALANLGKQVGISAISSGTEEILAEVAAVGGEVIAKNIEEGFGTTLEDFVRTLGEPETLKRFAQTGIIGAATGTAITGPIGAIGFRGQVKSINQNNAKVQKLAKKFNVSPEDLAKNIRDYKTQQGNLEKVDIILSATESLKAIAKIQNETKLNQISPEQGKEMSHQILNDVGLNDFSFIDTDLEVIEANNPELYSKILEFDKTRSNIDGTESGVIVNAADMIDLIQENPTLLEYARENPESPNPLEGKRYIERNERANKERQELLKKYNIGDKISPEDTQLLEQLNQEVLDPTYERGQEGYEKGVELFSQEVKDSLPERQIEVYEKAQENARESVSEIVEESFHHEEVLKVERVVRANEKLELENQRKVDAEEIAITNRFIKKEGRTDIAIDPLFLPDDLREAYLNDPVLKKRKVFKKGGLRPTESAFLAGVDDWKSMLKIVANSKTIQERAATRNKKIAKLEKQVVDVREKGYEQRLDRKFDNENKLRHMEMEHLGSKDRTTLKRGVKLVVMPFTKLVSKSNEKATRVIRNTKVGKLQVTQYNTAAQSHQRRSMNQIFNNEVSQAMQSKEKSILNNELTRESYKARKEINRAKTFIRNILLNKKNVANLQKSGTWKQVDSILSLYNLEGGVRNAAGQEKYNSFVKRMAEEGVEFTIPEHLDDIRERGDNLTVEQFTTITDRLRMINHQSKLKNKLLNKVKIKKKQLELEDLNRAGKELAEGQKSKSNYDESRSKKSTLKGGPKTAKKDISDLVESGKAVSTNLKNIMLEADDEQLLGDNHNAIAKPTMDGRDKKRAFNKVIDEQIGKIAEDHGKKEFENAFTEFIDVPEFSDFKALGYGKLTKSHLWRLLMYKGDGDGLARITNFVDQDGNNISMDTINEVLDTYLDEQDAKTVQNFTNIFKSFEKESLELHERHTDVKATKIKAVPIEHRGRVLDGGYASLSHLRSNIDSTINMNLELLGEAPIGEGDKSVHSRRRSAEQTEQGRFKERQKHSTLELDLNFNEVIKSYEEHIHDISYREVGLDTLKLLRQPDYKKALINTVGNTKYETVVNAIIETVGKDSDIVLDAESVSNFTKLFNGIKSGMTSGLLALNWTSVAMQPLSTGAATLRMGQGGKKHLANSLGSTLKALSTGNYQTLFDRANDIDNNIGRNIEGIEDLLPTTLADRIPTKSGVMSGLSKKMDDIGFYGLKHADIHIKVAVTNASYNQFVNGDVKGWDNNRLRKLSDVQVHEKAKDYAKQISDLALTTSDKIDKTRLEKFTAMKLFTMFFTDVRSQMNTGFSEYRKIKKNIKQKNYKDASHAAVSLFAMNALIDLYTSTLYGSKSGVGELLESEDIGDAGANILGLGLRSLFAPVASAPVIRDVVYTSSSTRKRKAARVLSGKFISDIATSFGSLATLASLEGLNKHQTEALLYTYNYAAGATSLPKIPINGTKKIAKFFDADLNDVVTLPFKAGAGIALGSASLIAEVYRGTIDLARDTNNPELMAAADELEKQLPNNAKVVVIPDNALISLAVAEDDFLNPETGAAGKYKFTQKMWDEVAEKHPELKLTDDGRLDIDNTLEQDKAMFAIVEDNAALMTDYGVEVNNENLYGAHLFTVNNYIPILLSKDSDKLEDVVSDMTLFKGFKTVKSVKDHVAKQIKD